MTARTHDAFALASLVTLGVIYPPTVINLTTMVAAVIGADMGALIPDMDQAGNRLWDLLPTGRSIGSILRRVFYKHRTLSHSLIGTIIFYKIIEWLSIRLLNPSFIDPKILTLSIMVGYISHLIADSLTEEGLPLLFPVNISFGIPPIRRLRIKTGKWFENLIIFPSIWIYLFILIQSKKEVLLEILKLVKA